MSRFARSGSIAFLVLCGLWLPLPLAAQPVLSVSPTSLSLPGTAGTNVPSSTVRISNAGNRALKWSVVQPTATWLTVSPGKGVNSGNITLTFKTSTLPAGQYSTSFRVEAEGSGAATVSVQINLAAAAVAPVPLVASCPSNKTVSSSTGSAVPVTYSATTTGGVAPVTVSYNPASGSLFPVGTTTVQVNAKSSDGQTATCSFTVTVTSTVAKLYLTCPSNMTVQSSNGSSVAVTYSATTSGGVAPVTVSYTPASGSLFPVGTTTVPVNAKSSDGQTASCSFTVTVSYTPATSTSSYGPRSTIVCPTGALDIWPGSVIPHIVSLHSAGTTYCLRAGVHSLTSPIVPKSGDTFVGEYGAILDGSGWTASDPANTQAAFRAHNQDIDYVTIRNLVIRNMPQRGIHAYHYMSDHWTIEYNEIASNKNVGVHFAKGSLIRGNYIHHNAYSGYQGPYAHNSILENNEIAYNGWEQKVTEAANVTFRNNFVHHNVGMGIWYDSNNTGSIVEGNRVEDNGMMGIFYEISSDGIIRNNTIRRNAEAGIMLSVSKNTQIYNNTLEHNFRGITYFLRCSSLGGPTSFDLANNTAHDNVITVGTQSNAFASLFGHADCTSTQVAPYLNGSKNLTFSRNTYRVPSLSGSYWVSGLTLMGWTDWRALGYDVDGTMSQ